MIRSRFRSRASWRQIEAAGYGVARASVEIPVTGMTCANCAMAIERTLRKKVPGVVKAAVNFATERANVEYVPGLATLEEMVAAIEKAGYGAVLPEEALAGRGRGACGAPGRDAQPDAEVPGGRRVCPSPLPPQHGEGLRSPGDLEPCPVGQLALSGPGDPGSVLHGMGLLHRRVEEPQEPERQHGCAGGHGFLCGLFLFPLPPPGTRPSALMSISRPRP